MQDSPKYLIHADITVDGVVERSDVVGAVFGQTEGLLGDELDLRDLQSSSKVGRIDVDVDSKNGQSFGRVTIATNLDRVETAILGASLETIERIGPCRSTVEIRRIEDAREAKRREIVDRAKTLLWEAFDETMLSSQELVEEVRETIRIEDITEYRGLPAGPRVADSDAIILVEGRSDVLTLLQYGIKNAIAVEGTNVPDAIADLTGYRTVTAFLDGDRGGKLILKELAQVAELDHVAFAPDGRSVEDLNRREVKEALRGKVPYERVAAVDDPLVASTSQRQSTSETTETERSYATDFQDDPVATSGDPDGESEVDDDGRAGADDHSTVDASREGVLDSGSSIDPDTGSTTAARADAVADDRGSPVGEPETTPNDSETTPDDSETTPNDLETLDDSKTSDQEETSVDRGETIESSSEKPTGDPDVIVETSTPDTGVQESTAAGSATSETGPETLRGHVAEVIDKDRVRLLDAEYRTMGEDDADDAFDLLSEIEQVPAIVVLDGELSQRVLDLAAQRGVDQIVADREGEFVKQPTSVRIRTAADLRTPTEA